MSEQNGDIQEHEKLRSLCALASSGTLTAELLSEVRRAWEATQSAAQAALADAAADAGGQQRSA